LFLYYGVSYNWYLICSLIYRILGIWFLGLTLSRGISGEPERPDIPRDKVSPKNIFNVAIIRT